MQGQPVMQMTGWSVASLRCIAQPRRRTASGVRQQRTYCEDQGAKIRPMRTDGTLLRRRAAIMAAGGLIEIKADHRGIAMLGTWNE